MLFKKNKLKIKSVNKIYPKGFSLIELLVSMSLFSFVSLIAIAVLVSLQQLGNNLKATRNLYDNMYFTVDEIGREIRQGYKYSQDNNKEIKFIAYQSYSSSQLRVRYFWDNTDFSIKKQKEVSQNTWSDPETLTNDKIKIDNLIFEIIGGDNFESGDRLQPSVKFIISGQSLDGTGRSFKLENLLTQRYSDD